MVNSEADVLGNDQRFHHDAGPEETGTEWGWRWTGQTSEGVTRPGSNLHLGTIFWGRIMKEQAWGQRLCVCLWEREGGTVRCSGAASDRV